MLLPLLGVSTSLLLKLSAAQCQTITTTQVGIATTVADLQAFQSSMDAKYGGSFTGYGIYESDALKSEGFSFVTHTVTETSCEVTETPEPEPSETGHTLPPSPTGSICSPHVDHWHCHPSQTESSPAADESSSSSASATCSPHHDHWHCPPGVESPTYKPSEASSTTAPSATATPSLTTSPSSALSVTSPAASSTSPGPSTIPTGGAGKPAVALLAVSLGAILSSVFASI